MKSTELQRLIAQGENQHIEFKRAGVQPSMVARAVGAFLNRGGGWILIGVADDGRVEGVPDAQAVTSTLQKKLPTLISPPALWTIDAVRVADKVIVLVEVPEGLDKPYVAEGAIYFRRDTITKPVSATRDEISYLLGSRRTTSQRWERQIAPGVELEDLDESLIRTTLEKAVSTQRWQGHPNDIEGFLHAFGLTENSSFTNAALVLYGKMPARLLPQARVRLLVLPEGKTADNYTLDQTFETCLLRTALEIPTVLQTYAGGVESQFSSTEWQRSDRIRYPMSALREGVMNALVHREYESSGSIQIIISSESLRISNPGGLPDDLRPADLKRDHLSLPRNPDIAHICYLSGLIEKIGRGTQRILEDCKRLQLREPKWTTSKLETSLTLFSAIEALGPNLTERQTLILAKLHARKGMKAVEVAQSLGQGITDRTVRNDLQILIDQGRVVRQHRGPSTTYRLADRETTEP